MVAWFRESNAKTALAMGLAVYAVVVSLSLGQALKPMDLMLHLLVLAPTPAICLLILAFYVSQREKIDFTEEKRMAHFRAIGTSTNAFVLGMIIVGVTIYEYFQ